METGIRPICYAANEFVLSRVPMDVVDAPLEVFLITDRMLPKTRLPNPASSFLLLRRRNVCFGATAGNPMVREQLLDSLPSRRIIGVALWQDPNHLQVIRQQTDREQLKRKLLFRFGDCRAKAGPTKVGRQDWAAIIGDERKIKGSTWNVVSTKV